MKIIDQDLFLCGARRRHNRRRRRSSSSSSSSTPPPPACQRRPLSLATRRASAARRTRRVERRGGARGAVCDCHKRAHRLRSVAGIVVPRIAWNEGRGAQSRRPRANRPGPAHAQSTAAGAPPAGPPARCGRRPEGRTEGSPQDRRRRRRVAQRAKGPLWALWPSSPANGKCRVPHGGALGASHALSPSCSQQGAEQASAASPSDAPGTGSILAPRQPCAAPLRALHHRHAPRAHGPGPGAGLSLSLSLSLPLTLHHRHAPRAQHALRPARCSEAAAASCPPAWQGANSTAAGRACQERRCLQNASRTPGSHPRQPLALACAGRGLRMSASSGRMLDQRRAVRTLPPAWNRRGAAAAAAAAAAPPRGAAGSPSQAAAPPCGAVRDPAHAVPLGLGPGRSAGAAETPPGLPGTTPASDGRPPAKPRPRPHATAPPSRRGGIREPARAGLIGARWLRGAGLAASVAAGFGGAGAERRGAAQRSGMLSASRGCIFWFACLVPASVHCL